MVTTEYSSLRNALFMKRSLTPGEIAVYLGHRKIWQKIVENGDHYAIVFEDDFLLLDTLNFRQTISKLTNVCNNFDMVKFFDFNKRTPAHTMHCDGLNVAIYSRPNSGLVGYMLSRYCCQKLLSRRYIFRPVDEELRFWFEFGIRVASLEPNIVIDNGVSLRGSLLDADRERMRARKSLLRSIYANCLTAYVNLRSHYWAKRVVQSVISRGPVQPIGKCQSRFT
ncbi:glycosyltransferase family 25 protein [Mesorhizobium sp. 10J20-29]